MSEGEIDVDELRTELDQIKAAMGIDERYEGATTLWLLFGLAVPVAAALSQYVVLERLPQWYHTLIWLGVLGGGAESALVLSIIVVMIGAAYGVLGASLRAYFVRRRDRRVFYVGTLWMVALGVAIPRHATLETWEFAAFGASYFVYAMAAYLVLRGGER